MTIRKSAHVKKVFDEVMGLALNMAYIDENNLLHLMFCPKANAKDGTGCKKIVITLKK